MEHHDMVHLGTLQLESDRLLLRRFTSRDAQAMYDNWASDPDVTEFLMWPHHSSVETSMGIIGEWLPRYDDKSFYQWAITVRAEGDAPVGSISAVKVADHIRMVHIGYCIGKRWWNKGITSGALRLLIEFFFRQVHVNRIESRYDPRNPNSGKVMQHCGLLYEGTHREADWSNQGICDTVMYAILAKDFFSAD